MKINKYQDPVFLEPRVDIYYANENKEVTSLIDFLEDRKTIMGYQEEVVKILKPKDVFYFE